MPVLSCECGKTVVPPLLSVAAAPRVVEVVILPSTTFAAGGALVSIPAVIKGHGGGSLALAAYPDLRIQWTSSDATVVADPATNPVELKVPTTPGASFTIQATVERLDPSDNSVIQTISSDPATIHVTPQIVSGDPSDWVFLDHVPGDLPTALVLEGREGATVVQDWIVGVAAAVRLNRNLDDVPTAELGIFGARRDMDLWPPAEKAPWTTIADQVDATGLPAVTFRELPVRVGLDVFTSDLASWAQDQITYAFALFDRNRLGIGANWLGAFEHNLKDAGGNPEPVMDATTACLTANLNAAISPRSITDPTDPTLYVLMVPGIGTTGARGWACEPQVNWTGQAVFVSWDEYTLTTLAHEIGHVLSMRAPHIDTGNGHTSGLPQFDQSNLMWSSSKLDLRQKRDHLAIGQVYRMNTHPYSWLNQVLPPVLRMTRACQKGKGAGACPALWADLEH